MVEDFFPNKRVKVFDPTLFIDDVKTPLTVTMKEATIVRWYGMWNWDHSYYYDSLIDVIFDHRGLSRSHITTFVKDINHAY